MNYFDSNITIKTFLSKTSPRPLLHSYICLPIYSIFCVEILITIKTYNFDVPTIVFFLHLDPGQSLKT